MFVPFDKPIRVGMIVFASPPNCIRQHPVAPQAVLTPICVILKLAQSFPSIIIAPFPLFLRTET